MNGQMYMYCKCPLVAKSKCSSIWLTVLKHIFTNTIQIYCISVIESMSELPDETFYTERLIQGLSLHSLPQIIVIVQLSSLRW